MASKQNIEHKSWVGLLQISLIPEFECGEPSTDSGWLGDGSDVPDIVLSQTINCPDEDVCLDDVLNVSVQTTGGTAPYTYEYKPIGSTTFFNAGSTTVWTFMAGTLGNHTFSVRVTDADNTQVTSECPFTITDCTPVPTMTAVIQCPPLAPTALCIGETYSFSIIPINGSGNYTYTATYPDSSQQTSSSNTFSYTVVGGAGITQVFSIKVTDNITGQEVIESCTFPIDNC